MHPYRAHLYKAHLYKAHLCRMQPVSRFLHSRIIGHRITIRAIIRMPEEQMTDLPVTAVIRIIADRIGIRIEDRTEIKTGIRAEIRIIVSVTIVLRVVSSRTKEVRAMAIPEETDRVALTDRVVRAWRTVKMIAAAATVVQVMSAVITIVTAMAEAMADREIDSQIINSLRASLPMHRVRILKRSARKTREGSVRRKISAPRRIISTKKRK